MKVRSSFVTNSSSTSYIISLKEKFSKDSFMSAIGADGDSPMNRVFEQLFDAVRNNNQEIHEAVRAYECLSVDDLLKRKGFDDSTVSIVNNLIADGRTVFFGELSSDGDTAAEIYFCVNSFVLSEDEIYFNGNISGW